MSDNLIENTSPGVFATSRRGRIGDDEIRFIEARAFEGRTCQQIARMLRRAECDVRPFMPKFDEPPEPEPVAKEPPPPVPGDLVLSLWKGLMVVPSEGHTMRQIAEEVAARYGVTVDALTGQSSKKVFVVPRQEAMWRMVQTNRWSQPQIGKFFGGRDHTTVLHATRAHEKRMAEAREKLRLAA